MAARLPTTPHAPGVLRLVGATLVDGTGAPPRADAEVELHDGIVTYAGPRRAPAPGVPVADLTGTWLLPGFIDTHVHLSMVPTTPEEQRARFPEEDVLEVAGMLRSTLHAGVTTARDLDGLTPGYRNAVARGTVVGPRLHLAIAMLSPTGGHADPVRPNGSLPAWAVRSGMPEPGVVDTDEDVVRTVRTLLRTGADAIKVSTSGGVGSPTDDPDDVGITEEQVRLVVRLVGERGGRPVTAHALTDAAARAAVLGGASSIEHGYDLSDDTIALMVERGTALVPTLSTLLRELDPATASEARLRHRAALHERGLDSVRRAVAAGVPVALGTDAGVHPHGRNLAELARLVQVGLSPLAAVTAGTLQGARLLGLEDRLGSVEPGKVGDLVVSGVDPLVDIGALADAASVRAVLQSGRVVKDLDGLVTTAS
ncbi:amidohydrolase family protein [Curtobacterium sp. ZW137]|uniref:metal-dependent hydrolase family protein n=1 Tax=Curtobacterium sp. ZW137 TaxID=2485104 RepID=UPI000F4B41A8|nr:amidohydrolase family protein [Curtobacterium sp. ZW137]ROP63706.1 imidazolonepropionase-like amidohydrolase [Curtobacterium sp. ZW137]